MSVYLDDSGTRHPDHAQQPVPRHGCDWFGIGGVIVRDADEAAVRERHNALCSKWGITYPLHSSEIRSSTDNFRWLRQLSTERYNEFMADLTGLATSPELTAIACVIDRPGYNARYREKYGRNRWSLCKTAFTIVVERAAKFARDNGCRLRVYVEKSDKDTDRRLRGYYDDARADGHPFDPSNAAKYGPLTVGELSETLYDFKAKAKSSPLIQLADLCLHPMCIGGYKPDSRAYVALRDAGILIDSKLPADQVGARGIKYSCWEVAAVAQSTRPITDTAPATPPAGGVTAAPPDPVIATAPPAAFAEKDAPRAALTEDSGPR